MALAWRSMIGWRGSAGVAVVVLLVTSLHPIVAKIRRRSAKPRSGTLEVLSGGDDAKFEIIAVHGLGADPDHTWTQAVPKGSVDRTQEPEAAVHRPAQSPRRTHLLRDLLALNFPEARILSFAHNSNWLIDAPVKTTEEIGKSLLEEIKAKRSNPHLPIIFIGHSLGGIIIKQALCRQDSQEIIDVTSGIIFLGTPHQGSSVSAAGTVLAFMTSFLGSDTTLLLSLKSHEGQLSNLADTFRSRMAPNERRRQKVPIVSFYETKPIYLLGWLSLGLVVSRNSAVVHADQEHSIDTDHSGLNKCAGQEDALYEKLKEAIGSLRTPSLLEQADTFVRDHYDREDRLKIERLSGDPLPMDQCYINLAIVEQSGQDAGHSKKKDVTTSPFSLLARQNVETPDKTIQVDLATIFNQRKGRNGHTIQPRRILIRGRAGVGKTTLCKKVVHDFIHADRWKELFDRILWVPLRNLKLEERRRKPGYAFEHLFSHEYFTLPNKRRDLAQELSRAWETKSNRTLFLLDGLDEVSQDLTGDNAMSRFLTELLKQPNVIITSRPSGKPPPDLDLELETIGFYPDQVTEYLRKTCGSKTSEVQSFLDKHWLIQGLVRIPIQLDALCYTWDGSDSETVPDTMTGIYKAIVQRLWKKDVVQLEKKDRSFVQSANALEIDRSVNTEIELLECLAFNGLYSDVIDFTPAHREEIVKRFQLDLPLDGTLGRLSFLRTSDPSSRPKVQNYHFLHLTFQEYFAALYFVRQWKDHKQLDYIFKRRENAQPDPPTDPVRFLREHKYTARYDIFWRFVAGLLDTEGQAGGFIDIVEQEPLDLLGPTHQRLVMHCLSEVDSSAEFPNRSNLEAKLSQWLLFECDLTGSSLLAGESECPDQALHTALELTSGRGRVGILKALQHPGRHLSEATVAALVAALKDVDRAVRNSATDALGCQSNLSEAAVAALVAVLEDEDSSVRSRAAGALGRQSNLSEAAVAALVAALKDEDSSVRFRASSSLSTAQALGGQSTLSEAAAAALVAALKDDVWPVRAHAADALAGPSTLSEATAAVLVAVLKDEDGDVRSHAADALGRQSNLSEATVAALVAVLKDEDSSVRFSAAEALGGQSNLSEATVAVLVAVLEDEDSSVRSRAAGALGRQSNLSEAAVAALMAALKDDDEESVRSSAAEALGLGCQSNLSEAAVAALVAALKDDEDGSVRHSAALALGGQSNLSEAAVAALVAVLKDEDSSVRFNAAHALGRQSNLSEAAVAALVAMLKDEHYPYVRSCAALALGGQSNLSEAAVAALVAALMDDDWLVRFNAADALGRQSTLSEAAVAALVAALVAMLKDEHDPFVRSHAAEALGRQSNLSEAAVAVLVAALKDESSSVRSHAAEALAGQSNLSEATVAALVAALVAVLKDEHYPFVRSHAAEALAGQSTLSEATAAVLVAALKDDDWPVRSHAADALAGQSNLSEATVAALVAVLKDEDSSVRFSAAQALGGQSNLSEAAVAVLVAMLKDEHYPYVRSCAALALGGQSTLSEATVAALVAALKDEDEDVRSHAADALGRQSTLSEAAVAALVAAVAALVAALKDDDWPVRSHAAEALAGQSNLLDKILKAIGFWLESERQAETTSSTVRNPRFVESLYGSLLRRSFEEQCVFYIDGRHSCIINQPSGLRTASFEQNSLLTAVSKGRQLWNTRGYKLWDRFEGDDAQQGPRTSI